MGVRTIGYRFTGDYRDLDAALDRMDARITASVQNADRVSRTSGTAATAAARGVEQTVRTSATAVEPATTRVAAANTRSAAAAEAYARAQARSATAAQAAAAAQERAALSAQAAQARTGTAAEIAAAKQVAAADGAAARVTAARARTAASAEVAARREVAAFERSAREQEQAVARVGRAQKKADDDVRQAAERRARASSEIGTNLLAVGAATAVGIGVAVKAFADFDRAMSRAQAGTAATGASLEQLRAAALQAGAATQYSATEAADAITALGKAGVGLNDILGGGLTGALNLAAAGQLDVADAAEIAATAMTQFGLAGRDLPHVADLLAAGAGKAQGEVTDLANALKYVGPVARGLNVSIEETTGVLAEFASQGIIGEQAGTSFRGLLLSLTSPSKAAAAEIKALGLNLYDSRGQFVGMEGVAGQLQDALGGMSAQARDAALGILFGNEQVTAARVLYQGGADAVAEWTKKVNDSGFAARQAATLTDNLAGDFERLRGAISTTFISSGSGTNDGLRDLTQTVTGLINAYGELPAPVQQSAVTFAALAAAATLTGGALLAVLPRVAATKVALIELTGSAAAARAALLAVAGGFAVVAGAAGADLLGSRIGDIRVADQDTRKLADSLAGLGDSGKLGSAGLDLFSISLGPLHNNVSTTKEALDRFATGAYNALDKGWDARLGRMQDFGASASTFRDQVGQLDRAFAELVRRGDADAAAVAFERLAKAAVDNGVPLASVRAQFPQYTAALDRAATATKKTTGATGELAGALSGADTEAQRLTTSMNEAADSAGKAAAAAFAGAADVLGSYDAGARDEKAAKATERLTAARERLAVVQERIASREKGASAADEAALARAQRAVDVAERATRAAGATSLADTYAKTIRETEQFTEDIGAALKRGLDPAIVQRLLQEGPQQAGPILRELVSDHSGKLIEITNKSERTLSRIGALAVEQARLTARAVASESDQMTTDLATAVQIATQKSQQGARATAESIAKALKVPPATVMRIADEFGITVASSVQKAVTSKPVTVAGRGVIQVEAVGTSEAIARMEMVRAAKAEIEKRKDIEVGTRGTEQAVRDMRGVRAASDEVRDKVVNVTTAGAPTAAGQLGTVRAASDRLKDKTVNVEAAGSKRAAGLIGDVASSLARLRDRTVTVTVRRKTIGTAGLASPETWGQNYATGGQVFGPGGPRDDRIPAWLSNREYVHPVAAVDHYGEAFMEAIRSLRFPRPQGFADGGQVGMASAAATISAATSTVHVSGTPAAPVVVRVPVHETRTHTIQTGDLHFPASTASDFERWATDLATRTAARYS